MKVRLEIIDDDGIESANVEFAGRHWKRRLLAFLGMVEDETENISEPSSYSSNSTVQVAEQNGYQPQFVQQPGPVSFQQIGQQTASAQQFQGQIQQQPVQQNVPQQFQQPMQQATVPQQYPQQPVLQSQMPAMNQQYQQIYPQQPGMQNYQPQQYMQPTLPPGGAQQYGYGQPAKTLSSTVQQNRYPQQQAPPAVSNQSARRRTPLLQDRLNDMSLTINERLELFLKYEYPRVWFSSQDVQQHYERIYGAIKQSTVSTYLSRMFRKNLLERRGNRTQREYRYIADEQESSYKMEEISGEPVYHRIQY